MSEYAASSNIGMASGHDASRFGLDAMSSFQSNKNPPWMGARDQAASIHDPSSAGVVGMSSRSARSSVSRERRFRTTHDREIRARGAGPDVDGDRSRRRLAERPLVEDVITIQEQNGPRLARERRARRDDEPEAFSRFDFPALTG